jgi:hypothetical protein
MSSGPQIGSQTLQLVGVDGCVADKGRDVVEDRGMRFARVDTVYLSSGWSLEIREGRYSLSEGIVNVLTSCTLRIAQPPAPVAEAFSNERTVSVAALDGGRFVRCTAHVVNVHRRPGGGTVAEIRSIGECHILDLSLDFEPA